MMCFRKHLIVQCFNMLCLVQLISSCNSGADTSLNNDGYLYIRTTDEVIPFKVEIANTAKLRRQGLMYRKKLPLNVVMLFEYEQEEKVSIWMKNTLIPLDVLFIQGDGTIAYIHENAEPNSTDRMTSPVAVIAVLEMNAGLVKRYGIEIGDRISYPFFK